MTVVTDLTPTEQWAAALALVVLLGAITAFVLGIRAERRHGRHRPTTDWRNEP